VQVGSLTNWSTVSVGNNFASAIKTDGTLWLWGRNVDGQLADGTVINKSSPVQIGVLSGWGLISAGQSGFAAAIFKVF
jgi:hypothetical protein